MGSSTGPPDGSGCARLRLLLAKLFRIFGKPQPAQGQFTPRHPLLVVDRLFRELRAFAHTLLIGIFGDHGACSDLCTPPLCPLTDIRFNAGNRPEGSRGGATRRLAANARGGSMWQVPRSLLPPVER